MDQTDKEQKLLEILEQPEISEPAGGEKCLLDAEAEVKKAYPELSSKSQKIVAKILTAEMPTPEELEQAERISQHNAEISSKRQERLAQRKLRRNARPKGKKGKNSPRRRRRG